MTRLAHLAAALAIATTAHAIEEVPFVTTPDNVTLAMLELARVGPKDYVIDLGSGDGRIVIVAAKKFGAQGLGVEIVPDLVAQSRANAEAAGVATRARFREQDLFATDLSPASVITMYLLPDVNLALRPALLKLRPGTRVVSHDWDMADWKPDQTIVLDVPGKKIGLEKKSRVHLWIVPARYDGGWCGTGRARGKRLEFRQSFQSLQALAPGDAGPLEGRIAGSVAKGKGGSFELRVDRDRLTVLGGKGAFASMRGARFNRAKHNSCA